MLVSLPICRSIIIATLTMGVGGMVAAIYPQTQSEDFVVAVVNGVKITQSDVDNSILAQIFPLHQQIHALRKVALENLVLRTLLEDEANKRRISIEELKKQLMIGKVEVSASVVEEEYLQNVSAFGAMSPDEAKERIRLSIESQERIKLYRDAVNNLRKTARIEIRLDEPRVALRGELGSAPAIGPKDAPVIIFEFTDFQCPFCRQSKDVIKTVLEAHKKDIRLLHKHLPLPIHENAFEASRAAYCAGEQDLFWQYRDALFASQDLSAQSLIAIASSSGLDLPKFKNCLSSDISRAAIVKDMNDAKRLGITSTPTFIINGRFVRGSKAFDEFKSIIEEELRVARADSRSNVNTPRKDQQQ